jgi:apolipoprotein N-acyltransferase
MGFKELSLSVLQNLVQNSRYLTFIHVIKTTFLAMPVNILISLWWVKTSIEVGQTQTGH